MDVLDDMMYTVIRHITFRQAPKATKDTSLNARLFISGGRLRRPGRLLCSQMKDLMQRQMVEIVIQAAANGKIVARETLKAFRKNVLAKCYGTSP